MVSDQYQVGDRVEAFAHGEDDEQRWYRGTVVEVPKRGLYIVRFRRGAYAGFKAKEMRPVAANGRA